MWEIGGGACGVDVLAGGALDGGLWGGDGGLGDGCLDELLEGGSEVFVTDGGGGAACEDDAVVIVDAADGGEGAEGFGEGDGLGHLL